MPRITFITDHTPKGQSPDIPTYRAGDTYDLEASYAEKYVLRGYAKPEEKAPRRSREKPPALPPTEVVIPADLTALAPDALDNLYVTLADDPVKNADALAALEGEKARRAAA